MTRLHLLWNCLLLLSMMACLPVEETELPSSGWEATLDTPIYTTYAAAMERSQFVLDEGYEFRFYDPEQGMDFITDTGGDLGLGFERDGEWAYRQKTMFQEAVIAVSHPDMVRYFFYPFEGIRVDATFLVYSSTEALWDIRISNQTEEQQTLNLFSFIHHRDRSFDEAKPLNYEDGFAFRHEELPDQWTLDHKVPYTDSIENIFLLSEKPDHLYRLQLPQGMEKELPALIGGKKQKTATNSNLLAAELKLLLGAGSSYKLRIIRSVAPLYSGIVALEETTRDLLAMDLTPFEEANETLFATLPTPRFKDADKNMLYRSCFNMMRQVFYPPEGKSSYNYYVFSREPTWGWGHGGQVFHESLTMPAYALLDPESAMNSQRVYKERQHANGYINYRTGAFLDEVIHHGGQLTSSAPWYAWQNWELYQVTRDKTFLREMYHSSEFFYEYYTSARDSDGDGLCEWGGHAVLESVRDGQVAVWDEVGWPAYFEGMDLNAMLIMEAKALESMARELGLEEEAEAWRNDHQQRTALFNQTFWDEETGFYYHVDKVDHDFSFRSPDDLKRMEIIGFLPLWAGIASERQAADLLIHRRTNSLVNCIGSHPRGETLGAAR